MLRRLKRLRDMDISLLISNDQFIRPPREEQRNWLVNRAISEFIDDLMALDKLADRFVPGEVSTDSFMTDRTQSLLAETEIMEEWQVPLMREMASIVTETRGDILEVGFGRGVSADLIQQDDISSHTIVECNDTIVNRFQDWRDQYKEREIRLLHGKWQNLTERFGMYDGIFFHTYVLNEAERIDYIGQSVTYAEHFFSVAARHLRSGGVFTYISNEIDSLSRSHQRALLQHFDSISLQKASLDLPENVRDSWWADSMMIVKAVKE